MNNIREAFEKARFAKGMCLAWSDANERYCDCEVERDFQRFTAGYQAGLKAAAKVCNSMKYADRLTKEACVKYILELADEA